MKPATTGGIARPRCGSAGQIVLAIFAVAVVAVGALKVDPYGSGLILLSLGGIAAATFARARLPLAVKASITGILLFQGFWWCLNTRSGHVGFSLQVAIEMAVIAGIFAVIPLLTSFLLWPKRLATTIVIGGAMFGFGAAAAVAQIEEAVFVAKHREQGIGLTSRWLMPGNGLWYDAREQRLYGCD